MAWVERFRCDVCGKVMGEPENWWIAMDECASSSEGDPTQPVLKLMSWDNLLGHSAESKHLCGAGCVHRYLDRWMADRHAGTEICPGT